jgi:hypothetical protein
MFVYALIELIDIFDGLTPLPDWILADVQGSCDGPRTARR